MLASGYSSCCLLFWLCCYLISKTLELLSAITYSISICKMCNGLTGNISTGNISTGSSCSLLLLVSLICITHIQVFKASKDPSLRFSHGHTASQNPVKQSTWEDTSSRLFHSYFLAQNTVSLNTGMSNNTYILYEV